MSRSANNLAGCNATRELSISLRLLYLPKKGDKASNRMRSGGKLWRYHLHGITFKLKYVKSVSGPLPQWRSRKFVVQEGRIRAAIVRERKRVCARAPAHSRRNRSDYARLARDGSDTAATLSIRDLFKNKTINMTYSLSPKILLMAWHTHTHTHTCLEETNSPSSRFMIDPRLLRYYATFTAKRISMKPRSTCAHRNK